MKRAHWKAVEARERAMFNGKTFDELVSHDERPVEGIELRNPPFPIRMFILRRRFDEEHLMFECTVPDRDNGQRAIVVHSFPMPSREYIGSRTDFVFDCLRKVFEHEMRECFFVDGKRVHDPHARDPR